MNDYERTHKTIKHCGYGENKKMNIAVNDMNACGGRARKRVFRALVKSFLSRF